MRNLSLLSTSSRHLPDASISSTAIDLETNDIYLTSEKLKDNAELEVEIWRWAGEGDEAKEPSLVSIFTTAAGPTSSSASQVLSARCLPETHALALVMRGGDIGTLSLDDPLEVEVVGSVDAGISAASWSPDESLLILITEERNLIVMTNTFDVLSESPLDASDVGEDQSVNVGWGSKSTQFHGSLGKAAARSTTPSVDAVGASPDDDARARVSWRGDGAYFVVSALSPSSASERVHRRLRVYDRHGALQTTSELVPGLEHTLSWRPSGNLIAGTQRFGFEGGGAGREGRHDVVFFERNGLRHGEFGLREGRGGAAVGAGAGVKGAARSYGNTAGGVQRRWGYRVKEMCWSADSNVLAVWIEGDVGDHVQLWTIGNYHWYLKHEVVPPSPPPSSPATPARFTSVSWHPEDALRLILTTSTSIIQRTYIWETYYSHAAPPNDSGSVAVRDGADILLTPFRTQNVPPPMSSCKLTLSLPPNSSHPPPHIHIARYPLHIAFSPTSDVLVALWESGWVQVWDLRTRLSSEKGRVKAMDPVLLGEGAVLEDGAEKKVCGGARQVEVFANPSVGAGADADAEGKGASRLSFAILASTSSGTDAVCFAQLVDGKLSSAQNRTIEMSGGGGRLVPGTAGAGAVWQSADGELFDCFCDGKSSTRVASFPSACPTAEIVFPPPPPSQPPSPNANTNSSPAPRIFIGLAPSGKLYASSPSPSASASSSADPRTCTLTLATNATSFTCAASFLIYTTSAHESHYVPLSLLSSLLHPAPSSSLTPPPVPPDAGLDGGLGGLDMEGDGEAENENENGGVAVDNAVIEIDTEAAAKKLSECEKRRVERGSRIVVAVPSAMSLVLQMPRGNLETIYPRPLVMEVIRQDIDLLKYGKAFTACRKHRVDMSVIVDHDIPSFMANIKILVDQVGKVDDLNLFLTSFSRSEAHGAEIVTSVCDAVRAELMERDLRRYVNSILTAFVVKSPADYEGALSLLLRLQDTDKDIVDDAVKYIIFLVDVERLYDTALGMYDFNLVLLVAQHSQKDPREYLPFLRELNALDEHYQHFKIDDHLRRYERALMNLHRGGQNRFEEAMAYMEKHVLYKAALELWKGSDSFNVVLDRYGEWLFERRDFKEAALVFIRGNHLRKAMVSYEKGLDWRELFEIAAQIELDEEETVETAYSIAEELVSKKRCSEAARVLLDYAKDIKEAVRALLQSNEFSEARRLLTVYKLPELLEELIHPAALDSSARIQEDVSEMRDQLRKQVQRLRELRQKKAEEPDAFYGAEEPMLHDVDVMTDVSMPATAFTRYTAAPSAASRTSSRRTSRSKRKMERKIGSGKKGTIDEEEYLLNSVTKLVGRYTAARTEAHSLLPHLLQFTAEHREEAEGLQADISSFEAELKTAIDEIWAKPVQNEDEPHEPEGWAKRMQDKIRDRQIAVERIVKPPLPDGDWKDDIRSVF